MRRILTATLVSSPPRVPVAKPAGRQARANVPIGAPGDGPTWSEGERLAVGQLSEATEVAEVAEPAESGPTESGRHAPHPFALLSRLRHRLHHLRDHLELLEQRVHLLGGGATALRDA